MDNDKLTAKEACEAEFELRRVEYALTDALRDYMRVFDRSSEGEPELRSFDVQWQIKPFKADLDSPMVWRGPLQEVIELFASEQFLINKLMPEALVSLRRADLEYLCERAGLSASMGELFLVRAQDVIANAAANIRRRRREAKYNGQGY